LLPHKGDLISSEPKFFKFDNHQAYQGKILFSEKKMIWMILAALFVRVEGTRFSIFNSLVRFLKTSNKTSNISKQYSVKACFY